MGKYLLIGAVVLFSILGCMSVVKKIRKRHPEPLTATEKSLAQPLSETSVVSMPLLGTPAVKEHAPSERPVVLLKPTTSGDFPQIDRVFQLFTLGTSKFPIVETVTYSSSVPWLKGRLAWLSDYAAHYNTSRHFIARSLNGKNDYFSQKVLEGSRFNVFRTDKQIQFYLLVDVSRCKMGFYYVDLDTNERVLIKTYTVGLGRVEPQSPSGTLTPLGRYSLGNRVAVYTPGTLGYYQDKQVEMVSIFGTRWIPFDQEIERVSAPAKGYGLQGAALQLNKQTGKYVENSQVIGAYESNGCIQLATEDMEEIFSIVISKPAYIEIVKDFLDAKLPGKEVAVPSH
jgi:hypothetical protein